MPPRHSKKANSFAATPPEPTPAVTTEAPKGLSDKQRSRINAFIKSLPDQVDASAELGWVRNHPAMLRRGEGSKGSGYIEITIEDLRRPPHGPAPSKAAVQMLRHHAQNPLKFFEEDLKTQNKRSIAEEGFDEDAEELEFLDDLKEVDRMIKEATRTTRRHREKSANG